MRKLIIAITCTILLSSCGNSFNVKAGGVYYDGITCERKKVTSFRVKDTTVNFDKSKNDSIKIQNIIITPSTLNQIYGIYQQFNNSQFKICMALRKARNNETEAIKIIEKFDKIIKQNGYFSKSLENAESQEKLDDAILQYQKFIDTIMANSGTM